MNAMMLARTISVHRPVAQRSGARGGEGAGKGRDAPSGGGAGFGDAAAGGAWSAGAGVRGRRRERRRGEGHRRGGCRQQHRADGQDTADECGQLHRSPC